jgi:hypothetical protein
LITDSQGIMDFQAFETSRKKFHEYVEEFRKQAPWEIVEADPEYCLGLMIEASELHSKKGETPPGDFLKWKALMGSPPAMPLRPLIHLYLKEEEWKNRADLLDRTGSLFENPSFQTWYLEEEEAKKYLTLLKEASESRLVLTPYRKKAGSWRSTGRPWKSSSPGNAGLFSGGGWKRWPISSGRRGGKTRRR